MNNITEIDVRMYRMGTGDCFVLNFFADKKSTFKMMIDGGTWSGDAAHCGKYISDLKTYVEGHIDVLVMTHEHLDHVHAWDVCRELLTENFRVDEVWMAWTEEDTKDKVKDWQDKYGNQKKALAKAASDLGQAVKSEAYARIFDNEINGNAMLGARKVLAGDLTAYVQLELGLGANGIYAGPLAGMKVVKALKSRFRYFKPGDLITKISGLPGIRFFVLGPPENWEQVKKESGGKGESYDHNKSLDISDAFSAAVLNEGIGSKSAEVLPFESDYECPAEEDCKLWTVYRQEENLWRNIDQDWLFSAGSLALRINSITNNLSLALAIEFEESGKIALFPGDAEYGSWASWHDLKWSEKSRNKSRPFMEDLLNRTVFYKVAHHLSHNGTAKKLGMEMMTSPELTAMATLDYDVISSKWLTTMPNQGLIQDLVRSTSGRLIVMNTRGLMYDKKAKLLLENEIVKARAKMMPEQENAFNNSYYEDKSEEKLYYGFRVKG